MINHRHRLFCRLDGLTSEVREQRRVQTLTSLGLLEAQTVPVFDEATQTAARFVEAPICILGLMVHNELWLKATVGLSSLGFMNQLATSRKIWRQDSFCTYVVDSHQELAIDDTLINPVFANSALFQHYGIRAYLGTPLITSTGACIGTLAVMGLEPRLFTGKEAEFLALTARWCLREFERDRLLQERQTQTNSVLPNYHQGQPAIAENGATLTQSNGTEEVSRQDLDIPEKMTLHHVNDHHSQTVDDSAPAFTSQIKAQLLEQLAEKLRTPLTSVMGMASVLQRGVYGSLTDKQKEYIGIIRNSGQEMLSLVEEIVNLGVARHKDSKLALNLVDIEMLCQQVLNSLEQLAKQQQQELRLSVEPGNRLWSLDKEKIRQALYYLALSLMESSGEGAQVRFHVSRRSNILNIAVWVSHPWLGAGLPQVQLLSGPLARISLDLKGAESQTATLTTAPDSQVLTSAFLSAALTNAESPNGKNADDSSRQLLGLLLSCHLVELHGGKITIQGLPESGCRYIVQLPELTAER